MFTVGVLAEGRLERQAPPEFMALAEWLIDELDPSTITDATGTATATGAATSTSAGTGTGAGLAGADPRELLQLATRQEWMIRCLQAQRLRTMAQAVAQMPAARRGNERISSLQLTSARIAPEVNCHPRTSATLLEHARGLVEDLPAIMALFEHGRLDQTRAVIITRMLHQASDDLDDFTPGSELWRMTEAMIASQAPTLTARELEHLIRRLLAELNPDQAAAAHEEAKRSRHVRIEALADGMALISALVTADVAQLLHGFLDAVADATRDRARQAGAPQTPTHDQLCADTLAALIRTITNDMNIPLATDTPSDEETAGPTDPTQAPEPARPSGPTAPGEPARPTRPAGPARPASPAESVVRSWQQTLERCGHHSTTSVLNITITDASLLGLDHTSALLQGHGPIPAHLARRLATTTAQINLIVLPGACTHPDTHTKPTTRTTPADQAPADQAPADQTPTGRPAADRTQAEQARADSAGTPCPAGLDHTLPGLTRYRPSRALIRLVTSIYPTCTFPGCTIPASRCDLDHLTPFEHGGPSCLCNLRPACRSHHRIKTFAGWSTRPSRTNEPHPPGTTIWTTPDGTEHHSPPPRLPGMPGWTFPTPEEPAQENLTRIDLMTAPERTTARLKRWQDSITWWKTHQDNTRQEAERRTQEHPAPLPRPWYAPWGESMGRVPGLGEPPF